MIQDGSTGGLTMTDTTRPDPTDSDRDDAGPGRAGTVTPRWVKVFGAALVLLALLFAIAHLTGNGMGAHAHHGEDPAQGLTQGTAR
jgi:hypothetical protein